MKICPNCQRPMDDNAVFCTVCGTAFAAAPQPEQPASQPPYTQPNYAPPQPVYTPAYDPYDHTAKFDPQDISENKVVCMLVYLMGAIGIIVALLIGKESPYTAFHVRQALKFTVVEILLSLITVVLFWTFIVPLAAGVLAVILLVLKIICFFQICSGKAKKPAIIRDLKFLK